MRTWAFLLLSIVIVSLVFSRPAAAEEAAAPTTAPSTAPMESRAPDVDVAPDTHPTISADATWAGSTVIGVGVMFLMAFVIGRLVRAEMPTDVPVAFSHDEDPGHHGGDAHGHEAGHGHHH
jgi:hypothetical protein